MKSNLILGLTLSLLGASSSFGSQKSQKPPIIGGKDAGNYPFMANLVSLNREGKIRRIGCGASFVEKRVVVTAAHCVSYRTTRTTYVAHNIKDRKNKEKVMPLAVKSIAIHKDYTSPMGSYQYDIAVLFLEDFDESKLSQTIEPIELNTELERQAAYNKLTVIGFGNSTSAGNVDLDKLQEIDVPIIDHQYCKETLKQKIDDNDICAGYLQGGVDSCQGDSGGPLFSKNGGSSFSLVGVVSRGTGCAQAKNPGIYTSIAYSHDWIKEQIQIFKNKELEVTKENLVNLSLGHCYNRFTTPLAIDALNDNKGKRRIAYTSIGKLGPLSETAIENHKFDSKICDAELENGSKIEISTLKDEKTDSFSLSTKVINEKESKVFHQIIEKKHYTLRMNCNETSLSYEGISEQPFILATTKDAEYVSFYSPELKDLPENSELIETCDQGSENKFSLYSLKNKDKDDQYYIGITSANLHEPSKTKYFASDKYPIQSDVDYFSITFKSKSSNTGTVKVSNDQAYSRYADVHTWELKCNFGFTFTDEDGQKFESTEIKANDNAMHKFTFKAGENKWGSILKGQSVSFDYESSTDLDEKASNCRINGRKSKIEFQK